MDETGSIWMDGQLVPWAEARVHVLSHALHYGTAVLEGTNVYETASGPAVFRLDDHLARLRDSARIIGLPLPYTDEELRRATLETVAANGRASCYIRHLAHRGYGEMGISARNSPVSVSIATWTWPGAYLAEGVRLMTSSWRRNDPAVVPTVAKAAGPYLNSVIAKAEALDAGFDEAVLLNAAGHVSEATAANLFVVTGGALATPPPAAGALGGITQDTVERLAAGLGIPVSRRDVLRAELYTADEVFLCGTAAGIVPVASVDRRPLPVVSPVTKRLRDAYDAAVHGRDPRYASWLTPVS
ncbi:branched-chain amino acid transaminase [Bailinhaonella thermotolerans]|uniref:Branched-chain-amino-acid aminotransferase n=1 Tax=Bailinhaonella thermotolerans TaxID=1070861 RepID=A0A3A4BC87_9ACTN|nr:branched-chain amino acid transaminase [Bailinhaonella thermotolerans]RJL36133.1 branched-chain amino acid transaminase [Bailinhaonella thermotolerans]